MQPTHAPNNPTRPGWLARALTLLASLRLAVVLLALFACCLAGATLLEARYDATVAQELVYRAWWFLLLLALLAVNVLGAAVKKYPWKRHQTGFLITHAGLLLLLLGGALTALFGVEGQMVLIDVADEAVQARIGLTNTADALQLPDTHRIEVYRLQRPASAHVNELFSLVGAIDRGEEVSATQLVPFGRRWTFTFRPGPLPWRYTDGPQPTWELRLLRRLAAPWPGKAWDIDDAVLWVDDFFPHAQVRDGVLAPRFVPPGSDSPSGLIPAVRCRLSRGADAESFALGLSSSAARVVLGRRFYLVRYRLQVQPVGFRLTLLRASQRRAPGTDRPASFQSEVSLVRGLDEPAEHRQIVMNQPLAAGGFRIYQANYRRLGTLPDGRVVSLSGLSAACDPGLWPKYAGSALVVLGIAAMFWMKAYFFRPVSSGSRSHD